MLALVVAALGWRGRTRLDSATISSEGESSFGHRVEKRLVDKFGGDAERVLECWKLARDGYEHVEELGDHPYMRQEARSYVPNLSIKPFWDVSDVSWSRHLEENWEVVRDEFRRVALGDEKWIKENGNNVWAGAVDTAAGGEYGPGWRTLVLMDSGRWDSVNSGLFPETCRLIQKSGVPCVEAFFASMDPQSDIKPHSDNVNFVLTSHLGLEIPGNDSEPKACRLSVGDQTRPWEEGQVMMFDTSLLHDAVNDSDKYRYILMMRVWHPDLSPVETKALEFIYDCVALPDLVSTDPFRVLDAESLLSTQRAPLDTFIARASNRIAGRSSASVAGRRQQSLPSATRRKKNGKSKRGFG